MEDLEQLWDELNQQPVHGFADWPNTEVPKGKPGVYLIYQEGLGFTSECPLRIYKAD